MKKTLLSALVLAFSLSGIAVSAQTTQQISSQADNTAKTCTKKECPQNGSCPDKGRPNPFADLNLTPEQQAKIDAINDQYRPKNGDFRKDMRREAKMRNDSLSQERKLRHEEFAKARAERKDSLSKARKLRHEESAKAKAERKERKEVMRDARKAQSKFGDMPKADRQEYLNKIKEVLTPEQYQKFLENSFSKAPGAPKGRP